MDSIPLIRGRYLRPLLLDADAPASPRTHPAAGAWLTCIDQLPEAPVGIGGIARYARELPLTALRRADAMAELTLSPQLQRLATRGSTVLEGVQRFCVAARTETSAVYFSLTELDNGVLLGFDDPEDGWCARSLETLWLSLSGRYLRELVGRDWTPTQVFARTLAAHDLQASECFAASQIRIQPSHAGIWIPGSHLSRRVPAALFPQDSTLSAEPIEAPLARSPLAASRQLLEAGMEMGRCRLQDIAAVAGVAPRSLQRALAAHGSSFRALIDEARMRKARELLLRPRARIGDVALTVDYADTAHFTRAFRRWFGEAPSEFLERSSRIAGAN